MRGGRGIGGPGHGDTSSREGAPEIKLTDRRMLRWFVHYLRPYVLTLSAATAAMVLGAVVDKAPPLLLGRYIIDHVVKDKQYEQLPQYCLLLLAAFFFSNLFGGARTNLMHRLGQRLVLNLRLDAYRHLQTLSLSYFERNKTGDIMSRLSNDVNAVEDMVVHGTDSVISDGLNILATVGLLLYFQWKLALYSLIPLPIFLVAVIFFSFRIRPTYRRIRDQLGEINAELQENIAGIRVIKAFAREDYEQAAFEKRSLGYFRASVKGIWMWTSFFPTVSFIVSSSLVIMVWLGANMTRPGQIVTGTVVTAGTIVMFIFYLQDFYSRFGSIMRVFDIFNQALAALGRIFLMFDEKPGVEDAPDALELTEVTGDVQIEHVTFKYATGEMVLHDISIEAQPGETVALVGRSGAGKTSLVNLIPRFYDPIEGRILVDGRDVREVTQRSLRAHMAMVLQETFLFDGTARENIRYGKLEATDEEVVEAARAAYAHDFIAALQDGYETEIGERGVRLSGGQAQRIAIARALLANPKILILDEATSLVDTEAEQQIQAALENLMLGRTTFVIAHRLSTVRRANKIVVIDDGTIVEEADHETLMAQGGVYADMYTRQFQTEQWLPGEQSEL